MINEWIWRCLSRAVSWEDVVQNMIAMACARVYADSVRIDIVANKYTKRDLQR